VAVKQQSIQADLIQLIIEGKDVLQLRIMMQMRIVKGKYFLKLLNKITWDSNEKQFSRRAFSKTALKEDREL
jgi:hypothetical protein